MIGFKKIAFFSFLAINSSFAFSDVVVDGNLSEWDMVDSQIYSKNLVKGNYSVKLKDGLLYVAHKNVKAPDSPFIPIVNGKVVTFIPNLKVEETLYIDLDGEGSGEPLWVGHGAEVSISVVNGRAKIVFSRENYDTRYLKEIKFQASKDNLSWEASIPIDSLFGGSIKRNYVKFWAPYKAYLIRDSFQSRSSNESIMNRIQSLGPASKNSRLNFNPDGYILSEAERTYDVAVESGQEQYESFKKNAENVANNLESAANDINDGISEAIDEKYIAIGATVNHPLGSASVGVAADDDGGIAAYGKIGVSTDHPSELNVTLDAAIGRGEITDLQGPSTTIEGGALNASVSYSQPLSADGQVGSPGDEGEELAFHATIIGQNLAPSISTTISSGFIVTIRETPDDDGPATSSTPEDNGSSTSNNTSSSNDKDDDDDRYEQPDHVSDPEDAKTNEGGLLGPR